MPTEQDRHREFVRLFREHPDGPWHVLANGTILCTKEDPLPLCWAVTFSNKLPTPLCIDCARLLTLPFSATAVQ